MKLGLMISAAIALLFGLLLYYSLQGQLSAPTRQTAPDKLVAVTLPDDPPALAPGDTTPGDAAEPYARAFAHYREHESQFSQSPPPVQPLEALLALLKQAAAAESVDDGFLDETMPVAVGGEPAFGDALESVPSIALSEADRLAEAGRTDEAVRIARAVWRLGRRAFENNVRLYNRLQGVQIMGSALTRLAGWAEAASLDTQGLEEMMSALTTIQSAWQPKLRIVAGVKPPIGDLVNLARHDQDRTFRVAATLRLGVARYSPGSRANLRAINDAIEKASASDDPLLSAAGQWAAALTLDEMKRLR